MYPDYFYIAKIKRLLDEIKVKGIGLRFLENINYTETKLNCFMSQINALLLRWLLSRRKEMFKRKCKGRLLPLFIISLRRRPL
ncbi:hypothetical protein COO59_02775 [Mixta theicola]|uniref:Uncharacterized protein n=1 Tax=Mixta theicola TaxID=1458355 RepID=A0A2K1QCV7_9GAMM|nr:hypothetical protein COO59_02775 [Mixta theicola]